MHINFIQKKFALFYNDYISKVMVKLFMDINKERLNF